MRTVDFSPLYRSTIGFDRLANLLETVTRIEPGAPTYPPYNIEQLGENEYRITMAVAGFGEDDLSIEVKEATLTITGKRESETPGASKYLHQGIAGRSFERRFQLAEHMEISGALLEHGLLHVNVTRIVPEEKKARRIPIAATGAAGQAKVIDATAAPAK